MIELIAIIIVIVTFVKASKNKSSSSLFWAIIGVVYYFIGRLLFSGVLYLIVIFLLKKDMSINSYFALAGLEIALGMIFGLTSAYILGEISGLNITRSLDKR